MQAMDATSWGVAGVTSWLLLLTAGVWWWARRPR